MVKKFRKLYWSILILCFSVLKGDYHYVQDLSFSFKHQGKEYLVKFECKADIKEQMVVRVAGGKFRVFQYKSGRLKAVRSNNKLKYFKSLLMPKAIKICGCKAARVTGSEVSISQFCRFDKSPKLQPSPSPTLKETCRPEECLDHELQEALEDLKILVPKEIFITSTANFCGDVRSGALKRWVAEAREKRGGCYLISGLGYRIYESEGRLCVDFVFNPYFERRSGWCTLEFPVICENNAAKIIPVDVRLISPPLTPSQTP